jgi:hypothetical protein
VAILKIHAVLIKNRGDYLWAIFGEMSRLIFFRHSAAGARG